MPILKLSWLQYLHLPYILVWQDSICLLQTDTYLKIPSIIPNDLKSHIHKQANVTERSKQLYTRTVFTFIHSVCLLGCAPVSLRGQLAAFWSITVLSEHQELLALWHSITSQRTWILHTALFEVGTSVPTLHGHWSWNVVLLIHPNTHGSKDWAETCHTAQKSRRCRPIVCLCSDSLLGHTRWQWIHSELQNTAVPEYSHFSIIS
jgi:hypothetical protein